MSSDSELERLLREARGTLPEPGAEATRRARARALTAARRRRRRRLRVAALACLVLVVAGLGIGVGALIAPSGEAARGPVGLGFLPEPGWYAFQSGGETSAVYQTIAVASNVPLEAEDQVAGMADPSGLPYATLLKLPANGIVMVASFTRPSSLPPVDPFYPKRKLPLRLSEATPYIQYGTQIRPEEPLGQHQLRAEVNGYQVTVYVYFGTPDPSSALLASAQRQLDRMIVRTALGEDSTVTSHFMSRAPSTPGVVDRTFSCSPSFTGGVYKLYASASKGSGKSGATWERPAFAGLRTRISGSAATAIDNYLVWLSAGRPSAAAMVWQNWRIELFDFPYRVWGTIAVNRTRCRASTARVPLSARGLVGGRAGVFPDELGCTTPKSVLVRVRAVTESRATLTSYRNFVRTLVPAEKATIAVQTPSGKRLAFAELSESGASRILVAQPPCYPN
jgi:hypothetical protein